MHRKRFCSQLSKLVVMVALSLISSYSESWETEILVLCIRMAATVGLQRELAGKKPKLSFTRRLSTLKAV